MDVKFCLELRTLFLSLFFLLRSQGVFLARCLNCDSLSLDFLINTLYNEYGIKMVNKGLKMGIM